MGSVEKKARKLVEDGNVFFFPPSRNVMRFVVTSKNEKGEINTYNIHIWSDGHYTCTCPWFHKSSADNLDLWVDDLRARPECSHCIAGKISDDYKEWIRSVIVRDTEKGKYVLRSIEPIEQLHVLTYDENFNKKLKKTTLSPIIRVVKKKKIPLSKLTGN